MSPQQMVEWEVLLQVEGVKEPILSRRVIHHGLHLHRGETACKSQARYLKNRCSSTELAES